MNIREVMRLNVSPVNLEEDIATAAQMMQDMDISELVVVDKRKVVGVLTERDIVWGCVVEGHTSWQCQVFRHMTIQGYTVSPDTHIGNAAITMIDKDISVLPVTDNGKLIGLVSSSDIFEAVEREEISHSAFAESMI